MMPRRRGRRRLRHKPDYAPTPRSPSTLCAIFVGTTIRVCRPHRVATSLQAATPVVDAPKRCRLGARSHPGPGFLRAEKQLGDDVADVDAL